MAHRFVENQGDAWTVTGAYLGRFIDDQRVLSAAAAPEESPELASYLQPLTANRHAAPASCKARWRAGPTFRISRRSRSAPADIAAWTERLIERSDRTFDLLADKRGESD